MEISLESVESHAVPHSILPNHTEGHRLNGRDALSRKAGLRLGKDSAGVGVKNLLGQSSLKYCRRRGLNRCPLAWELGTLPLDQLDLFTSLDFYFKGSTSRLIFQELVRKRLDAYPLGSQSFENHLNLVFLKLRGSRAFNVQRI